ncbi:MAG: hydroxymethylglutaryl-CoA reductase [Verrucomicrobiota bacterium]
MAAKTTLAKDHIARIIAEKSIEELEEQLTPTCEDLPARLPISAKATEALLEKRWERIETADDSARQILLDPVTAAKAADFTKNIENLIGTVKVPLGIAGPLRINGLHAKGDYFIPLATTEAALVASYSRGAALLTAAGGCTCLVLNEAVSRSPAFAFESVIESAKFVTWMLGQIDEFKKAVASTTSHGQLIDVSTTVEGNHVYLNCEFTTGDASGQNMVTIATQAICEFIVEHSPVKPAYHFIEGNLSGDKKASAQSFTTVRGKKVCAEVKLPAELVTKHLHTSPKAMTDYWRMSAIGGVLSGTVGVQGHFANGLAALYIACGQDAACVAESAVGVTRFEVTEDGSLYASVTLPNIMVGTVGGGTSLPSQKACLEILGLHGPGHSQSLAEVCSGLLLGGELSIIGALTAGHFAKAHKKLARE